MVVVTAYVALILLGCTLAWLLWQFEGVRRLDDRVLGKGGIAAVASIAALLLATFSAVTLVQRVWAAALLFGWMSSWVGFWAYRRVDDLRRTPHG